MILKFWGTRGSIPVPGIATVKYGGNTPCVEVRSKNNLIILDAGSGIRELGNYLVKKNYNRDIEIFLSHYHWDHIQGIPFFKPLYQKKNKIRFYGQSINGMDIGNSLKSQMMPIFFPIKIEELNSDINFVKILPNKSYKIGDITVVTFQAKHSSPTLTFKIIEKNKAIIYMTDNELNSDSGLNGSLFGDLKKNNKDLIKFCNGCDYLIHDAMYDDQSVQEKKGWGHSSNISLAYFGIAANVKNLVLFHYNPDYTDEKIDSLIKETKILLKSKNPNIGCIAAKENLELSL